MTRTLTLATLTVAIIPVLSAQAFACAPAGHNHGASQHQATDHSGHAMMGHDMAHQQSPTPLGDISVCASYMHMMMDGVRDGTNDLSVTEVGLLGYDMAPTEMNMDMAMFGIGLKPLEWLDLSIGSQFIQTQMRMIHDPLTMAHNSQHSTGGIGDTTVGASARVYHNGMSAIRTSLAVSLPTGSIDEKGVHGDNSVHSPYDMQLGTGTYDLLPSVSLSSGSGMWDYGVNIGGRIHLGTNDNGYSWGDKVNGSLYAGYRLRDWLRLSATVGAEHSGKIDGEDDLVTQDMPTGNADFYGGTVVTAGAGFDITPTGFEESHALSFQFNVPVYQNYNGLQMKKDYDFTIAWKTTF